jgi:hypothetical protein
VRIFLLAVIGLWHSTAAFPQPIRVHPSGHYFVRNGVPVLLITSDHHYGAVINADFNYDAFLDKLKSRGMNFTRIYPGPYLEKDNLSYAGNPLAPANAGKSCLGSEPR